MGIRRGEHPRHGPTAARPEPHRQVQPRRQSPVCSGATRTPGSSGHQRCPSPCPVVTTAPARVVPTKGTRWCSHTCAGCQHELPPHPLQPSTPSPNPCSALGSAAHPCPVTFPHPVPKHPPCATVQRLGQPSPRINPPVTIPVTEESLAGLTGTGAISSWFPAERRCVPQLSTGSP